MTRPDSSSSKSAAATTEAVLTHTATAERTFHVDVAGDDTASGGWQSPFRTIHRALAAVRSQRAATTSDVGAGRGRSQQQRTVPEPAAIVLHAGEHFLNATIELTAKDSGLTITASAGAAGNVTVSGGIVLTPRWKKSSRPAANPSANIWETDIPSTIKDILGLQTLEPHRRVVRAREPNADQDGTRGAELCVKQHGHPNREPGECWHGTVGRWHKNVSCDGAARTDYVDLRDCDDAGKLPSGAPCFNQSAMWDTFNTYTWGHGGCCNGWPGDHSPYGRMGSYFCGNASAGGWVGFDDPRPNRSVGLSPQRPFGFDYNQTDVANAGPFLASLRNPAGAIFHVHRNNGWYVNMFEIASNDASTGSIAFKTWADDEGFQHPVGGWQGGASGWMLANKTVEQDPDLNYFPDVSGWLIENVWEALDMPNEFFFDPTLSKLYLIPNASATVRATGAPDPAVKYVASNLLTLISINGTKAAPVRNVTVQGITFRDAADITMEPWGAASDGDWSLYRGGGIFIEGAEGVTVQHNLLRRLDGNGIFVSGYTRDVTVQDNEIVWTAFSPIASWGYTKGFDGTDGQQPRDTRVLRNYVHEWGHQEIQSSMWSNNLACLSHLENNVAFNAPRAAINFSE